MEIKYSGHAVERMMQRHVSTQEVEALLARPDGVISQSMDKIIAWKRFKGTRDNAIAVVAVETTDATEVITVMVNFEVKQ